MENNQKNREIVISNIKYLSEYFTIIREKLCEPYGLSEIQAIIVLDIYHNPNNNKITDICQRLAKETNTISPLIKRLEKNDFIVKKQDSVDKRISRVYLSERGNSIIKEINQDIHDYTWPMFDKLSNEEFDKLYDALIILKNVLD